jgi:hypothetical protein
MSAHGGFGLALQLREKTLNELLVMAHRVGNLPRWTALNPTVPDVDTKGKAIISFTGWVDAPHVSLSASKPDMVSVSIRTVGKLTINANTISAEPRQVRIDLTFDAGADVRLKEQTVNAPWPFMEQKTYDAALSFAPVIVTYSDVVLVSGSPIPSAWSSFFQGPIFRIGAALSLAQQLSDVTTVLPSEFVPFVDLLGVGNVPGPFGFDPPSTVSGTARAGNGFLTLAFDVFNQEAGVATAGKVDQLESFMGSADVAAVIDGALAPLLADGVRKLINYRADGDYLVTWINAALANDRLHITGHGETGEGDADFSFDATPRIGKPGYVEVVDDEYGQWDDYIPPTDEIWVDLKNVNVDTDVDFWVYALGIPAAVTLFFLPPVGLGALAAIAGAISDAIAGIPVRIVKQGEKTLLTAHQKRRLWPKSVPVALEVVELGVYPDKLKTRIKLTPQPDTSAGIVGAGSLPIQSVNKPQKYKLLGDPMLWDPHDPEPRIRWQIRRYHQDGTSATVFTIDRAVTEDQADRIKVNLASLGGTDPTVTQFSVEVRVYRNGPPGSFLPIEVFNQTAWVAIEDRLDRTHPYVRWHRDIVALTLGKLVIDRRSALHRTAYPGRCLFADQYSYDPDLAPLQYLDELPFPIDQLPEHRHRICEYCFYGGPDKDELIFDPTNPKVPAPA